jgi:hypothetical protein
VGRAGAACGRPSPSAGQAWPTLPITPNRPSSAESDAGSTFLTHHIAHTFLEPAMIEPPSLLHSPQAALGRVRRRVHALRRLVRTHRPLGAQLGAARQRGLGQRGRRRGPAADRVHPGRSHTGCGRGAVRGPSAFAPVSESCLERTGQGRERWGYAGAAGVALGGRGAHVPFCVLRGLSFMAGSLLAARPPSPGELRVVHTLARKLRRDIVLATTSVDTPAAFVDQLYASVAHEEL